MKQRVLVAVALLWFVLCSNPLYGNTKLALDINSGPFHRNLAASFQHLEDPTNTLTAAEVLREYDAGKMKPVVTPNIDFGFSRATHWLAMPLINPGAGEQTRILSFNMRFMQELDVFLRSNGRVEQVLSNGRQSDFSERGITHRHLAVPVSLPATSESVLLVRYWSEGTTALPVSLESAVSFAQLDGFHTAKNAAFYAFVGFMLIYAIIFGAATRSVVVASYGFYLFCVALYMLHMDGYAFQYLWPNAPVWNASAALPLGLSLNVGAAVFSICFLSTRQSYPNTHRVMLGIIAVCVLWSILGAWLAPSASKQFAFPFTFLCALLFLGFGIRAVMDGMRGAAFYVVGWTGLTCAALFTTFSHWSAGELVVGSSFEIIRLGVLIDATMMAMAVLWQYNELRRVRNEAIVSRAQAAQEVVAMQHRFFDLEERYAAAFTLAEERSHQLAAASHDLRQPLAAMRMAMRGLSAESPERQLMADALTYLENLLNDYITSVTRADGEHQQAEQAAARTSDAFSAFVVLDNLSAMYIHVAARQGVRLTVVRSSATLKGDPIVLLRILNNLVDNALKHAQAQRVLVGFRRGLAGGSFVVLDDGVGLHHTSRQNTGGFGLGLDIVARLCSEHTLDFVIGPNDTRGTHARVSVGSPSSTEK